MQTSQGGGRAGGTYVWCLKTRTTDTPLTDNEPLTVGKAVFHTGFDGSLANATTASATTSADHGIMSSTD